MFKKIIVAVLAVSVLGAAGAALAYSINASEVEIQAAEVSPIVSQQTANHGSAPQANQNAAADQAVGPVAEGMEGEPYQASGTIVELDDFGMTVQLSTGESQYIELGPPDYWQNQGVDLAVGKIAFVVGTINDGMIHASTVILDDGQILTLRSEDGQPMWSGGATSGQGQSAGSADGSHTPDPASMVQADEWVTLNGSLLAFQGGSMTIATDSGEVISFQTGQPRFFSSQGVTFQIGDQISVVGFYSGEQFSAGDITQLSTGERVMLRDPNGRPLWAGPGAGNGNGGGGKDTDG
ncbi:MAG: hypothetical protein ABFS17_06305 [Chloroflexota bacterium]